MASLKTQKERKKTPLQSQGAFIQKDWEKRYFILLVKK